MFQASARSVEYSDPWSIPLTERLKIMGRSERKVAYYYEAPNNSTFRYRAYNMTQVLNSAPDRDISAGYFFASDMYRVNEVADLADVLVICRSGYNSDVNRLIGAFRVRKKRVLFDVDDLVFDTDHIHLIINTLNQDFKNSEIWDYWFAYVGRMGQTMRMCDGAITTNQFLAARIAEYAGFPVGVVPNFINREQLNISNEIYSNKKSSNFSRNGKVSLGYFSGSPSHQLDYEILVSALEDVLINNPSVDLTVVGYIDVGSELKKFGQRITYKPFHDYVNLQRLIGSVEFNLMPLQRNMFTNCKSDLKYFEAAIVGTVSIASPSETYSEAIRDGSNGYISYAHQWSSVINNAVDNMDKYSLIAENARADAFSKYAWFNQKDIIVESLGF
ncbi:MAG: hypothetical protein WCG16_11345 [Methylococcales bacterium]